MKNIDFGPLAIALTKHFVAEVWVLQTDGRFIYNSANPEMLDHLISNEGLYHNSPALRELSAKIFKDSNGSCKFKATATTGGSLVEKTAMWTTVKLHDTLWRIVIIE